MRGLVSSDTGPTDKPVSRDKKIAKATEKMFKARAVLHRDFV